MRILTIFGTRPEAVKLAPVIKEIEQHPELESVVCVSAQHRQMLDQVLNLFEIVPDYDLDLMRPNQTLSGLAARIFMDLDPILAEVKPDWVLVQGDTTTVVTASMAAFYRRIKVGHVEAGLRSGNKWEPFPEEINRKIAGVTADLHFAPTNMSRDNLLREAVPEDQIFVTGNTVIDALLWAVEKPFQIESLAIPALNNLDTRVITVTAHRRENHGRGIENICQALRRLADHYGEAIHIVYPVHLNPHVQEPVYRFLDDVSNITLLPPLDYLPLVNLLKRSALVLTDSGGLQEEAPGLGVPVLVLRDVTERPEGIQAGTVKLVGTDPEIIIREVQCLLDDPEAHAEMARAVNPYGDGQASQQIVKAILEYNNS